MRRLTIMSMLCMTLCATSTGCAGFFEYRREQVDRRYASKPRTNQVDSLWKQGYGFNNPNNERIRQGLKPIHFHGKAEDDDSYFGQLFGDLLVYSMKWTFVTIGNRLRR